MNGNEQPGPVAGRTGVRGTIAGVTGRAQRVWRRPGVQHLVTAINRYNDRLGTQFAGSMTYFSFLALVPILMVAFAVAGFILASRPDMLTALRADIALQLPAGLSSTVTGILDTAVDARLTVGIFGLIIALYSGISWMGNLRAAIQAMWRPDFDRNNEIRAENLLQYYWKSLQYLVFLGLAILISLALTAAGSSAQTLLLQWLGLDEISWLHPVFTIIPIVLAVAADVLVFAWLYQVLSPRHLKPDRRALLTGAVAASAAFEILKLAFTVILPLLLTSTTAKLFGQVIGLLFFFNLVATAVLVVGAWIATTPGKGAGEPAKPDPTPQQPSSPSRPAAQTGGAHHTARRRAAQ
jgi:membrane protein